MGVDLYGIQQELARYQMMLESMHDEYSKLSQERNGLQAKLSDVRTQYRDKQFTVSDERKKGLRDFLLSLVYVLISCILQRNTIMS